MCFSNLPVEFDDEGNPYLADEAEEVERPGEGGHGPGRDRGADAEVELAADPEGAYEAIVASLPADAQDRVDDRSTPRPAADGNAAGDD